LAVQIELLDIDAQRLFLAVPHHLDRYARARLRRDDHLHELVVVLNRSPVVLNDHVARLHARLGGRAARDDGRDDGAHARLEPEVLIALTRHLRDLHADSSADDLDMSKLWTQITDSVDRHSGSGTDV